MSPLGFLLLLGLTAPQDHLGFAPPQSDPHALQGLTPEQQNALEPAPANARRAAETADASTCYTIRSYIFRRQDGDAPVHVGTTTCTPADILRRPEVSRPPRVRLVPAK